MSRQDRKHMFANMFTKDVHRRKKLTTDFFQTFGVDYWVVTISIPRKKLYFFRGSYFKGPGNEITGFVHIQQFLTTDFFTTSDPHRS